MDIPNPNRNSGRALRRAAATGNVKTIKRLLAAGATLSVLDNAPLRWAVRHKRNRVVRVLVDAGASLEPYADDLLVQASQNGDAATLKLLLRHLPSSRHPSDLSELLKHAVKSRNVPAAKVLLDAGADTRVSDNEPIKTAVCGGDVPMLKLLLRHGTEVGGQDPRLLYGAVFSRSHAAVTTILALGADPKALNGIPLQLAILNGDTKIAETLLNAGVPLSADEWVAGTTGKDALETLLFLISRGTDLAPHADLIAEKAIENVAPRVLGYVLDNATVNNSLLSLGLETAVRTASGPVLRLLLAKGADPRTSESAALKIAIKSGELVMARWILQAGADVQHLDSSAVADLLSAGDRDLLIDLLRRGLNVDNATLVPMHAATICQRISPEDLFRDTTGKNHVGAVRSSRITFAKHVAETAKRHGGVDPAVPTLWFANVLAARGPETRPKPLH
jgi:ankyrin repeat protein